MRVPEQKGEAMQKFILSLALIAGTASLAHAEDPAETPSAPVRAQAKEKSLYTRLGGKAAIKKVVHQFTKNVAGDKRINARFAKTNIPKLEATLVDQVCEATGGPCKYKGKTMADSHKGMKITEEEWSATVEDLTKALDKYKVGEKEKGELLGALGGMKADIVGK
jgi:hemoglobin